MYKPDCKHTKIKEGIGERFCVDAGCYMCDVCGVNHQGNWMVGGKRYCDQCLARDYPEKIGQ
jgi:hypothetical protein